MKASIIAIAAVASVASAVDTHQSTGYGNKYNCAKPNASYCIAGDIILRCDGNSVGTPGRCSDNLAGYPPAGGVASCYQSSLEAGDAACEKNCIVHAEPSFTLPATQCSASGTGLPSSTWTTTPSSVQTPTGVTTQTSSVTTASSDVISTPTLSTFTASRPFHHNTTVTTMPGHKVTSTLFVSGGDSSTGTGTGTGPTTTPTTAAAVVNRAGGLLAGVGLAVAYFL